MIRVILAGDALGSWRYFVCQRCRRQAACCSDLFLFLTGICVDLSFSLFVCKGFPASDHDFFVFLFFDSLIGDG